MDAPLHLESRHRHRLSGMWLAEDGTCTHARRLSDGMAFKRFCSMHAAVYGGDDLAGAHTGEASSTLQGGASSLGHLCAWSLCFDMVGGEESVIVDFFR